MSVRVLVFKAAILGAVSLALAACGGQSVSARTSSASSASSPAPGGNVVAGKLVQLSGGKLVLSLQNGTATVTFDSSTRIQQTATGSLADITTGRCVNASGQQATGGAITAVTVQVSPATNGTCAAPGGGAGAGAGQGRFGGRGNGGPANLAFVRGQVTSVSGTFITVQPASGSPMTVTVPTSARITTTEVSSSGQLAVGECVLASGQADSGGTVSARTLSIQPPGPNGCVFTGMGGPRGRPTAAASTA